MSFGDAGERNRAWALVAVLAALACALLVPAGAAAEVFEVNGTGDEPDASAGIDCPAGVGEECTLRAALEASNASVGESDVVVFDGTVFEGQLADTIALGSSLPAIVDNVRIEGRQCATAAGVEGPCEGINGPGASNPALTIEDTNGVEIEGLAVTGAQTGVNIIDSSQEVRVKGSWLGVKLDGSAGGNTTGIFIDPESNGDRIGGESAEARNVFANNAADGLQILGADETLVLGNYFGVKPDGATLAGNGEDVEVASQSAGGFEAERNLVGVQAESGAATTPGCDKGCNVIAGATGSGVDLQGDSLQGESPSIESHVAGNFVGLGADGTTVVANGFAGVLVGSADGALVGGPEEEDEANFFAGGSFGVYEESADDLQVLGNAIGFNPNGVAVASPGTGLFVFCLSSTEPTTIEGNAIGMDAGVGIEQRFLGATIAGNFLEGGETGILTTGSGAEGNLIQGNLIEGPTGIGILLKSDANEVVGNEVVEAGASGIQVQFAGTFPTVSAVSGNLVGGNTEAGENAIFGSGGDAIAIRDLEESENEVGRNYGNGNAGRFIHLIPADPFTESLPPNKGIEPPAFASAKQTEASGTAEAGALVRVFRKASAEAGELQSFLGEAEADGEGKWKVAYASIPGETIVAATQTSEEGGTSELATATTPAEPSNGGGGGNNGGGGGGSGGGGGGKVVCVKAPCPGGGDTTPPRAKISKGPKAKSSSTTAKFKFSSNEAGSTFQCKLDKKPFKKCRSPKTYKKLKPGKHLFKVRAIDKAGNVGKPAKRKFTVLG